MSAASSASASQKEQANGPPGPQQDCQNFLKRRAARALCQSGRADTHSTHIWRDNQCDLSPNLLAKTIWRPSSGHHKASAMLLTAAQKSSWQPQDPPPSQCAVYAREQQDRQSDEACLRCEWRCSSPRKPASGLYGHVQEPSVFKGALRTHLASLPPQEQNRTDGGEHVAAFSGSLMRGHGALYLPMA